MKYPPQAVIDFIIRNLNRRDCPQGRSLVSVENDADEISRTAGRQRHSHSIEAGGLVVTSRTTREAWGTSLTMRAETRAMRS